MKTKTLFLSLFAGAFLCCSTTSFAQYHHSGSSSGGSGDGAFDEGVNDISVGVGFAGGGIGYANTVQGFNASGASGNTYSSSSTPGIRIDWERGKSEHIGYGIIFQYQGSKFTDTYNAATLNFTTGQITENSYVDTYSVTFLTIAARGNYHFTAGKNFDPYVGITLGYVIGTVSYSSTDPNAGTFSGSASAIALGAHAGARYMFSDHIGAFAEFAFCTNYAENYANLGLTFKL